MISNNILSKSVEFHNFTLSLLPIQNFSAAFSASFEFQKFQSQNMKAITKEKKVNIAVESSISNFSWDGSCFSFN
jgi:hypothetical protein